MCGRFVLAADALTVQQAFNLSEIPGEMVARYNIAPSQPVAVIANDAPMTLTYFKWGLVPSWAKDPTVGYKMINARSETAAEKPSFRAAFKRRRCIIPADGFYEWQQGAGGKTPLFIHMDGRPVFGMAGLWESWQSPDGGELRTCAILTTSANDFMRPIHDRMPVILEVNDYALWLDGGEGAVPLLQELMKPAASEAFRAYPVSKAVNKPGIDGPELIEPLEPPRLLL